MDDHDGRHAAGPVVVVGGAIQGRGRYCRYEK